MTLPKLHLRDLFWLVLVCALLGCGRDNENGPAKPVAKAIVITAESVHGRWKSGKMVLELCKDGKAIVQDTQTVWPLDEPERKEEITTTYEGDWKVEDESVLEITFPTDGAPPFLRGGRYRTSLEQDTMTMSRLDGSTILDGPSWIRLESQSVNP